MEERLVIRLHPWRQLPMTMMMVVANVVMALAWAINFQPNKALGFCGALAVLWGIYILEAVWIRLVVAPEHVRMISAHWDPRISREQIYNIRALRWNTVFYDRDGKRILETHMDMSRSQLLALGNELGVNVWNHRAWHGLKELQYGVRVNPESSPDRPPG